MNCQDVTKQLLAYGDDTLDPMTRNQIAFHLKACDRCRAEQAGWVECLNRLKQVEVADPGERFWNDFTASVKQAIAKEISPSQSVWERIQGWFQDSFFPSVRWAVACAAVVVVVVGLSRFAKPVRHTPLSLEEVVHSADLSNPEGVEVLFDLMDDSQEEMDLLIGSDL